MKEQRNEWTIEAKRLAELLLSTSEPFMRLLQLRELSSDYLKQSRVIIEEFARVCLSEDEAHPWQLRQRYLEKRPALRFENPFSKDYLKTSGRVLTRFLRWYQAESLARGALVFGQLSSEQLDSYWKAQDRSPPYQRQFLSWHLPGLLSFLDKHQELVAHSEVDQLLRDYQVEHHLARRGNGYGFVLTHRAGIVTRRHLCWLEREGHLPEGTAASAHQKLLPVEIFNACGDVLHGPKAMLSNVMATVDRDLPEGLRKPVLEYVEHMVYERELVKDSIRRILRPILLLCRHLASAGHVSYSLLNVAHLDEIVSSLISAPADDLLRRRQQVQQRHTDLRGFLRYLHQRGILRRDLAAALISPPCYRSSTPPKVLSEEQVQALLESVDRSNANGRRCYAILRLLTTYGLRPIDVSRLRLDDLHWREERLSLVQSKTSVALTLPLLPEVAEGLYAYLRSDRHLGSSYRQVFLSLDWPHRPLCSMTISHVVASAFDEAGLPWASARHLRTSVATHLLRQGEPLSVIQEVLGHRTAETTRRYAVTDIEQLRQVLSEEKR